MRLLVCATAAVLALAAVSPQAGAASKTKTKDVRSQMTPAQKADIRKKAFEWCRKKYAGGGAYVFRVEILSDGRVRCWYKG